MPAELCVGLCKWGFAARAVSETTVLLLLQLSFSRLSSVANKLIFISLCIVTLKCVTIYNPPKCKARIFIPFLMQRKSDTSSFTERKPRFTAYFV